MDIVRELDLMFFVALCTVTGFVATTTYLLMKQQKIDDTMVKLNTQTWIYFWVFHLLSYVLGLVSRLYLYETPELARLVDTMSMNVIMIGITIKVFYVEKLLDQMKKHYFTWFNICAIIYTIAMWRIMKTSTPAIIIGFIFQALGFAVLPLMYLYLAFQSSGRIRKNALFALVGLLIIEFSLSFQVHNIVVVFPTYVEDFMAIFGFPPQTLNPIFVIGGTILVYKSYSTGIT